MLGRCYLEPVRPGYQSVMPCNMLNLARPVIPVGGGYYHNHHPQTQIVVEPPVVASPNIYHNHHFVEHVQPVITQDIYYNHGHHKYVACEQKQSDQVINYEHGLCGPATTRPAMPLMV